jgi:plasmid maintenance system antidote protein VapI
MWSLNRLFSVRPRRLIGVTVTKAAQIRLSKAFGGSPEVWLRMQMSHDLWHTQRNADQIKVERYVDA